MVAIGSPRSTPRSTLVRLSNSVGATGLKIADGACIGLFLTLPWGPHWPFGHFGVSAPPVGLLDSNFGLADLFLTALVIGWSLALVGGKDRMRFRPLWISIPLLLFTLSAGMAVVAALDQAAALRFAVRTASLAIVYLFLSRGFAARWLTASTLAYWLAPGVAFNGLLAVSQTIHQNPIGIAWLAEPQMLRTTPGTAVILVHGARVLRAFGVMPHANVLGGLLAGALPLVAGPLLCPSLEAAWTNRAPMRLYSRGIGWRARSTPLACLSRDAAIPACLALMAAGVVLSFSRSAWVGLLVAIVYFALWWAGRRGRVTRRAMLVGAGILIVTSNLLVVERDAVLVRLRPESNRLEQFSIQQRLALQALTLKVIAWRPLTGVGGNNDAIAEARFLPLPADRQTHPFPVHNTYVLAQAELGPLGAGSWIVLMLVPLAGLRRRQGRGIGISSALAGGSLIVVAIAGLFDYYIWTNGPVAVLWVTALASFSALEEGSGRERQNKRSPAGISHPCCGPLYPEEVSRKPVQVSGGSATFCQRGPT